MGKIGLVLSYKGINYGALLQAYATQHFLDKNEYESVIIDVKHPKEGLKYFVSKLENVLRPMTVRISLNKRKRAKLIRENPILNTAYKQRMQSADSFRKQYLHDVMSFDSVDSATMAVREFDAVLVGSDQQWNPAAFNGEISTLLFVPDSVKKISYATSLGVSSIPKYLYKKGRQFLSRIDYLSVRELSGKRIVDQLIPEKAKVVLDPTLLLAKDDWDEAIPEHIMRKEPYVFCYFLGDNPEQPKLVEDYCKNHNLKMIVVRNVETYTGTVYEEGDEILDGPAVSDFVNYIRGAELVCTDSFHCTVFSIINHKNFVTFYRLKSTDKNSRNSRIDDLLGSLGIEQHICADYMDVEEAIKAKIDYDKVDEKLSAARDDSAEFLIDALRG